MRRRGGVSVLAYCGGQPSGPAVPAGACAIGMITSGRRMPRQGRHAARVAARAAARATRSCQVFLYQRVRQSRWRCYIFLRPFTHSYTPVHPRTTPGEVKLRAVLHWMSSRLAGNGGGGTEGGGSAEGGHGCGSGCSCGCGGAAPFRAACLVEAAILKPGPNLP